jgi:hypothetical protein
MADVKQDFKEAYRAGRDAYENADRKTLLGFHSVVVVCALLAVALKYGFSIPWYGAGIVFVVLMTAGSQVLTRFYFRK